MLDLVQLHQQLVEIPSVSGSEGEIADFVYKSLTGLGCQLHRIENNVIARTGFGPKLILNSHLDTVPVSEVWGSFPTEVSRDGDKIIGLGANDAKASVAAMMVAFATAATQSSPCDIVLMLVQQEETGGNGTEMAWPFIRDELNFAPAGVVVGEPTNLQPGIAQKGLMVLDVVARGTACHSANAARMGVKNPIYALAQDLAALQHVHLGPQHPELGHTTLQPTVMRAGDARNQVPGEASAVIDIRTVPGITHEALFERISGAIKSEVAKKSMRLEPYSCSPREKIVRAALKANPGAKPFASATMSDQVFFKGVPAIKCGPGQTERSHTVNEYVLESELKAGEAFYRKLIKEFAKEAKP